MAACAVLRFVRELQQGNKAPPSIVIIGDETHLINEARTAIEQSVKDADKERLDFADLGDNPSMGGGSLFGGTRVQNIVGYSSSFRNKTRVDCLGKDNDKCAIKHGKSKKECDNCKKERGSWPPDDVYDSFAKIMTRKADNDIVIASFYGFDDKKMQGKMAWLRRLEVGNKVKTIRAMQCDESATAQWCKLWLPKMDDDAATYIAMQSAGNFGAAKQAVMKMQLYGGTTQADAEDALRDGKRYGVFDMTDKLVFHKGKDALRILAHLLANNESPYGILGALGFVVWSLLTLKRGGSVNIWGSKLNAMQRIANYESEEKLLAVVAKAARADRIIKGAVYKNTDDKGATIKIALTNLVVDIASLGRKANINLPGRAMTKGD